MVSHRSLCVAVFIALVTCNPSESPRDIKLKCFKHYLYSRNLYPINVSASQNCDDLNDIEISNFYAMTVDTLKQKFGKNLSNCVAEHVKKIELHEEIIKIYVYERIREVPETTRIATEKASRLEYQEVNNLGDGVAKRAHANTFEDFLICVHVCVCKNMCFH